MRCVRASWGSFSNIPWGRSRVDERHHHRRLAPRRRRLGRRASPLREAALPRRHPPQHLALNGRGRLRGYVFAHLLAELAKGQEAIAEAVDEGITFPERHVYLLALLSLTVFYGLERAA